MRNRIAVAIIAEILFLLLVLASDWRDVDPLSRSISDGVHIAGGGWLTAAFLLHAVSLAAAATADNGRIRIALLVAATGMLFVAVFPTDPVGIGISGTAHMAGASLAFGGVALAAMLGPRRGVMGLLHAAVPVTLIAMTAALASGAEAWKVLERVQVFVNGAWLLIWLTKAVGRNGMESEAKRLMQDQGNRA